MLGAIWARYLVQTTDLLFQHGGGPVMACTAKVLWLSAPSASLYLTYLTSQNRDDWCNNASGHRPSIISRWRRPRPQSVRAQRAENAVQLLRRRCRIIRGDFAAFKKSFGSSVAAGMWRHTEDFYFERHWCSCRWWNSEPKCDWSSLNEIPFCLFFFGVKQKRNIRPIRFVMEMQASHN